LQEDVAGECSKFGKVKDCIADRRHPNGRVLVSASSIICRRSIITHLMANLQHALTIFFFFTRCAQVRFFTVPDCVSAQQKMHGRFFAKRQILTEYLTPEDFDQLKKETGK
jgi:hypothetical protein